MDKLIHTIEVRPTTRIQVAIREFKENERIDLRTYFQDQQGSWIPSKQGISLPTHLVDELVQAVGKLQAEVGSAPKQRRLAVANKDYAAYLTENKRTRGLYE